MKYNQGENATEKLGVTARRWPRSFWIRAVCCGGRHTEDKGERRRARAREDEQLRTAATGRPEYTPTELRMMAHYTATIRPPNRSPK